MDVSQGGVMELLYVLLDLLAATRLFGALAERLGLPMILGERIAGITDCGQSLLRSGQPILLRSILSLCSREGCSHA
ncbi:MAG: hypothetical protein R6X15_00130 [Pseudomonadota bacterium]